MKYFIRCFILVLFSLCINCNTAFCCYSGLLVIPTTDVIPPNNYSLELQYDFLSPIDSDTSTTFFNTQFGIMKGLELGVDFDLSKSASGRVIGNGKYGFNIGGNPNLPFAIGSSSINSRFKSLPYMAIGPQFGFGRMQFGALRSEGHTRWFTGFDRTLNDKWSVMADYTSGYENFWSVAVNYNVSDSFNILTGVEFSNNDSDEVIYSIHLAICGRTR